MTYIELINKTAERVGLSRREAHLFYDALLEIVIEELKVGKSVDMRGFVKISPFKRHARKGVNPHTLEIMDMPEVVVAKFKAGSTLKRALKK